MWRNQQRCHQHQYSHLHLYPPRRGLEASWARVFGKGCGSRIWLGASATPKMRLTDRRRGLRPSVPECQTMKTSVCIMPIQRHAYRSPYASTVAKPGCKQ